MPSRYDVELADAGSVVRVENTDMGTPESRPSPDGAMTMHEFKCYGTARIGAVLAPPDTVAG